MPGIRVVAGVWSFANYGDGGVDFNRPVLGRWCLFRISAPGALDSFIPQNSAAERDSVYNTAAGPNSWLSWIGQYGAIVGTPPAGGDLYRLYNNVGNIGNGPCWVGNGAFNSGNYITPPACPGSFPASEGVFNGIGNPLDYTQDATIKNSNDTASVLWCFWQTYDYGCGAGNTGKFSVRKCYRSGYNSSNTGFQTF